MVHILENEQIPQKLIDRDIVFFDGNCVLCHNLVRFVLAIDRDKHFLLCSQQSDIGHLLLKRHGINVDDLSTIYVICNCATEKETVKSRSAAIFYLFAKTPAYGGLLALAARILSLLPRPISDFGYNCVAKTRYQTFGKTSEACTVPSLEDRERIIG